MSDKTKNALKMGRTRALLRREVRPTNWEDET